MKALTVTLRLSVERVKAGLALTLPVPVTEVKESTPSSVGMVRVRVEPGGRGLVLRSWSVSVVCELSLGVTAVSLRLEGAMEAEAVAW